MMWMMNRGLRLLVPSFSAKRLRQPGWLLLAGFLVLPMIITCSSGSKGGNASVALLVKMPSSTQQQASATSVAGFLARLWDWVTGVDAVWAAYSPCNLNCRLIIDVSAPDLSPQYTTIQNVSAGTVTVNLLVPSGSARIFRVTLEQDSGSGFVPVYAGCHSGVELAGGVSTSVPIELAPTTTCLRVIVLGGGPQLNQPLSGIRVIRHANVSPYSPLDDKVSDANGIVEFGDIDPTGIPSVNPERTTVSFVLKRTDDFDLDNNPPAETVLSLVDVPVTGDVRFNVVLNNFDQLNLNVPVRAQLQQGIYSSPTCSSSSCVLAVASSIATDIQNFSSGTRTSPTLPIYQLQSDGNYSVLISSSVSNGQLSCGQVGDQPPTASPFTVSLSNQLPSSDFSLIDPAGNLLGQGTTVYLEGQTTFYKGTTIELPLGSFQSISSGSTTSTASYCPPPTSGDYRFILGFIRYPQPSSSIYSVARFGVMSSTSPLALPVNDIDVSFAIYGSNAVLWNASGSDINLNGLVTAELRWGVSPQKYRRLLIIPGNSQLISQVDGPSYVSGAVTLPTLPLLDQSLAPISSPVAPYTLDVTYSGAGQFDQQLLAEQPPQYVSVSLPPDDIFRRLFGRTGSYMSDVVFDSATTWVFETVLPITVTVPAP